MPPSHSCVPQADVTLTSVEVALLGSAGESTDQTERGRAVAIVLSKQGDDRQAARRLLAESYLGATSPSSHLIPRGDSMLSMSRFSRGYSALAAATNHFRRNDPEALAAALIAHPESLGPLRMIAGLTLKELAVAVQLATGDRISEGVLRTLERDVPSSQRGDRVSERNLKLACSVAKAISDVIGRRIFTVPEAASSSFHSKLDKPDTAGGWSTVAERAESGVQYSELLYQRYVGGVWRQVQDAYSEVKGDAILELPTEDLLLGHRIPYWRSRRGAAGARETVLRSGIEPGPDFLVPDESPAVIIETKVVEDGGSARDKAARIQRLGEIAQQRGLVICAVVDGRGWSERPHALADVVLATGGRTFSLSTLAGLVEVPEIATWKGTSSRLSHESV